MVNEGPDMQRLELVGMGSAFCDDLCETLADSPLFADLQYQELRTLAGFMHGYRAQSGALIFEEGEAGAFLCLLLDGRVAIEKEDHEGIRRPVAALGPGKTFGEMAVIDGERRSASCIAVQESTLAILTRGQFERVLNEYPVLGVKFLLRLARVLSQRLRVTSGQLVDFIDH